MNIMTSLKCTTFSAGCTCQAVTIREDEECPKCYTSAIQIFPPDSEVTETTVAPTPVTMTSSTIHAFSTTGGASTSKIDIMICKFLNML